MPLLQWFYPWLRYWRGWLGGAKGPYADCWAVQLEDVRDGRLDISFDFYPVVSWVERLRDECGWGTDHYGSKREWYAETPWVSVYVFWYPEEDE